MKTSAAAVFVKTPGLSPVKSRLAASVGTQAAEAFYRYSCRAIEEVLKASTALEPFWAVAEYPKIDPLWSGLPCLAQGSGGLGERLHTVYSQLLQNHHQVLLLGADAPQISCELIEEALQRGRDGSFVIGPAHDGGFYLFAGSQPLPAETWTQVAYSQSDTLAQLRGQMGETRTIHLLKTLQDVDEASDLWALMQNWRQQTLSLMPQQIKLLDWCLSEISSSKLGF